ncbi:hypothetical protein FRC17_008883 [Serendipita sp. 399]|nr:hypothetical protein FRC17_008883 [Serendipita sp. 399]
MDAASRIAKAIPRITTFFADPKTARFTPKVELISDDLQEELLLVGHSGTSPSFLSSSWSEEDDDAMGRGFAIAQWYIPNQGTLLIFVNLLDKPQTVSILPVHGSPSTSTSTSTEILLSEGVKVRKGMSEVGSSLLVDVEATGSAIVVLT